MRFRLDSDVAVFIAGDYGGEPPIEGRTVRLADPPPARAP